MAKPIIHPRAENDIINALESIEKFFASIDCPEKADLWKEELLDKIEEALSRLEEDPKWRPVCTHYPFSEHPETQYRSFKALWFRGYYVIEGGVPALYWVRSAKADMRKIF
ncbi:MAG: hypothetical protein FWD27_04965 [Coriobacteriia bacterium]|nr:hypothetical protein [Coriobacteriia bacterium]